MKLDLKTRMEISKVISQVCPFDWEAIDHIIEITGSIDAALKAIDLALLLHMDLRTAGEVMRNNLT